jgi:prepilin-type N-terminal cleavage/methylation domain-containing protein
VSGERSRRHRAQAGFTLVELLIASALGLIVMSGLASVVLTTSRASQTASDRVEAAGQIRGFQQVAYNDFAGSSLPVPPGGCGSSSAPCTHSPIQLQGCQMSISSNKTQSLLRQTVIYAWPSGSDHVLRQIGTNSHTAATNVTAFSWYVDGTAPNTSVVVTLTVTMGSPGTTLSQSQTMRFYPRVDPTLPVYVASPC